ncbi:hypothetical protein, partial [Legionella steigerwaltii]|uniref:hypothetical protein n=1 Tax=Legionella steigerwaltii TaxID=460 RepID=UPI0039E8F2FF
GEAVTRECVIIFTFKTRVTASPSPRLHKAHIFAKESIMDKKIIRRWLPLIVLIGLLILFLAFDLIHI